MRRTPFDGSGMDHGQITETELLNLKKNGQFPDESVSIKGEPIHYVVYYEGIKGELNRKHIKVSV